MAKHRICRAANGRFKRCGSGGSSKRKAGKRKAAACKFGKVKTGKRKGLCRKQRRRRR